MPRIKITKVGKNGDQKDYSFVRNMYPYYSGKDEGKQIKDTMGAIPREEANVEVENGEEAIGDMAGTGEVSKFQFKGKSHANGGIPVKLPQGTFIYSKALKINDDELVKKLFGLNKKKGGWSFSELSSKYDINKFTDAINDPNTDDIEKRSAQMMLDNNIQKLAEIALLQEQKKGWPDGVPDIVESIMPGIGEQVQQAEQQQAKFGGKVLPKAYTGTPQYGSPQESDVYKATKKSLEVQKDSIENNPKGINFNNNIPIAPQKGQSFYINNQPVSIKNTYKGFMGDDWIKFDKPITIDLSGDGTRRTQISEMTKSDFDKLTKENKLYIDNGMGDKIPLYLSQSEIPKNPKDIKNYLEQVDPQRIETNKIQGSIFTKGNKVLQVVNPNVTRDGKQYIKVKTVEDPDIDIKSLIKKTNLGFPIKLSFKSDYIPIEEYNQLQGLNQDNTNKTIELPAIDVVAKKNTSSQSNNQSNASTPKTINVKTSKGIIHKQGGIVKYQQGGSMEDKPKSYNDIKVGELFPFEQDGKLYMLRKSSGDEDEVVFEVYKGSRSTPTGKNESWAESPKKLREYIDILNKHNINPNDIKSAKDFQDKIYDITLQENPQSIYDMWSNYGQTIEGNKYPEIKKQLNEVGIQTIGSNDAYKIDFDHLPEDKKRKAAEILKQGYVDNKVGVRTLGLNPIKTPEITDKPTGKPQDKTPTNQQTEIVKPNFVTDENFDNGPWYLPDINNFTGALTDVIHKYRPTMSKIDSEIPNYALMDPTRQLAANQEAMAQNKDFIEDTVAGNIGAAAVIGNFSKGFENAANVLAQTENQNVGITNQALANASQIKNNENILNEQLKQKYLGELANFSENYDKEVNQKKWREIGTFNRGWDNASKKKMLEQVMFPQVRQNAITGNWGFSGKGRDIEGYDTYVNPLTNQEEKFDYNSVMQQSQDIYDKSYQSALLKYPDKQQATRIAEANRDNFFDMAMGSIKSGKKQKEQMAEMLYRQEFGGTIPDLDFFD